MRFLILIALCLTVASASYSNKNRFNRLLRQLQQQQEQQQGYGSQGLSYNNEYDSEEQDEDDEDNHYQGQQQNRQCQRNQRYGNLNLNDDENDNDNDKQYDDQDQYGQDQDDQDQYQNQNQRQGRQGRQGRHQRQQYRQQNQQYDDQDQYGQEQDDQDQYQNQNQRQGRQGRHQNQQNQQQRRQQQQQHQCQPKYQLLQALEEANTQLASKLYKQAKQENDDKNTVVSPAAVQLALAAIQRGARGNTKRQIQRITGAGLNQKQNQQAHTALKQSLQGQQQQQENGQNQQAQIKTTTTIIINQRNRAQQKFVQAVRACLNTQVKKCNFQQQHKQCRQQINRHVSQKTNQKLQHVVPQDAVTANTKLIVVNTAQINAKWSRQVRQQQQTKQGKFYPLGSQQPKQVQVLKTQGQMNYYEDEQLQVVGLPTQQQELTLYVIVPKDKDGLNQIEKAQIQNGQQLKQLLENAEQQQEQVDVELPKFQIQHKIDAKQTLRQQGVQDAFDQDEANFAGINGQQNQEQRQRRRQQQQDQDSDEEDQDQDQDQDQNQNQQNQQNEQQLHVNKLIHQATIKINEQGISAANNRRQNQQNQNQDDQDQDQYQQGQDEDEDDQEDEQEQQYRNKQEERQEMEEIFGQRQQRNQRNRGNQQQRRNQRNQYQGQQKVKANRAFAFAVKHNPSNQIVLVGRVVDATQKPQNQQQQQQGRQQGQQSLNGVDQQ
jgi:serpin B